MVFSYESLLQYDLLLFTVLKKLLYFISLTKVLFFEGDFILLCMNILSLFNFSLESLSLERWLDFDIKFVKMVLYVGFDLLEGDFTFLESFAIFN